MANTLFTSGLCMPPIRACMKSFYTKNNYCSRINIVMLYNNYKQIIIMFKYMYNYNMLVPWQIANL